MLGLDLHIQLGAGPGQAVAVGGHQAQGVALGHEQNAVQVVANVLHRHGKRDLVHQVFERFLRHAEGGAKAGGLLHQREVWRGQRLQGKAAFAAFEQDFVGVGLQRHRLVGGHGFQDVHQLARADGGGKVALVAAQLGGGADLNFQIAGGQLHRVAHFVQQHVGQNRHGVAPLDDAADRLQYGQDFVLCGFEKNHVCLDGVVR